MDIAIMQRYESVSKKAGQWLIEKLKDDGSLAPSVFDLGGYYLLPYLFSQMGYLEPSRRVLAFIQQTFMTDKGNFFSKDRFKTEDTLLTEFPCLANAWIAIAAQRMGQFQISYKSMKLLRSFYNPDNGSFCTKDSFKESGRHDSDALTTAQLGLVSLYFGDVNKAKRAGNFLISFLSLQPDIHHGFYLHAGPDGRPSTSFSNEQASLYVVMKERENQQQGILGLMIVFLCHLYQATKDEGFLSSARAHMNFLHDMKPSVFENNVSSNVAWAVASLAGVVKREELIHLAIKTTDHLVEQFEWNTKRIETLSFRDYKEIAEFAISLNEIQSILCRL